MNFASKDRDLQNDYDPYEENSILEEIKYEADNEKEHNILGLNFSPTEEFDCNTERSGKTPKNKIFKKVKKIKKKVKKKAKKQNFDTEVVQERVGLDTQDIHFKRYESDIHRRK
eukprot:CAMPEP_0205804862 /NCGR_PEP_ID=MMETSP0205-20121125/7915_1 /ASSEMBLY_ACC=CAM_ASM_000278 /TAXON_ID=36767 /ORGANISM="Euplotes focardii, Strain TN1" /LENGTH=113 /DNA_ID=CAMNT_0053075163 /DNA_START=117 /DNA_END=458 /DNA_ORIENTATION=+